MDREVRLAFQLFGGVKLDTYVYIYIDVYTYKEIYVSIL